MTIPRIVSTLQVPGCTWREQVVYLDRTGLSGPLFWRRVVAAAAGCSAVILNGSIGWQAGYVDLLAGIAIRRQLPHLPLVIAESAWQLGPHWPDRLACRLGLRALDGPRVAYGVQATEELMAFPRRWGVDPARVALTLSGHTLSAEELAVPLDNGAGVLAAGDSLRDYGPLLAAAERVDAAVTIATGRPLPSQRLPPNVQVVRVERASLLAHMRRAAIVLVPLLPGLDRPSGQFTILSAMALGRLVIATDGPGVRDYIEDGITGRVIPPGNASALAAVLRWALNPTHQQEVAAIRKAGQGQARERFGPENYAATLLEVAGVLHAGRSPRSLSTAVGTHVTCRGMVPRRRE